MTTPPSGRGPAAGPPPRPRRNQPGAAARPARGRPAARGGVRGWWSQLTPRGRRLVKWTPVGALGLFLLLLVVLYVSTDVPDALPDEQSVVVLHNDGTELGRIQGEENRTDVPLDSLPEHVRQAVLAAEDESFYDHSGVSPRGIFRALFRNVQGGGVSQGGSTITQQYAKTKFKLSRERSLSRKVREVMVAVKLERRFSKDEILERYLNTIYFGRGAYGIEAASKTFFGVPARALKVEQAAVLATLIRSPEGGDPARRPELAKKRWDAVLVNMAEEGWLPDGDVERLQYPRLRNPGEGGRAGGRLSGPKGHVLKAVEQELAAIGLSPDEVSYAGLRVTTTIDKRAQDAAVKSMNEILPPGEVPADLLSALVSVEPGTGAIKAMYGGRDYTKRFINDATDNARQPGSSFKPIVLAAAIEEGIGLRSRYDGSAPQEFPGRDRPVNNCCDASGKSFGRIDLVEATAQSVNTVYFRLALDTGPRKVISMARGLGIPDADQPDVGLQQPVRLRPEGGLGLGESEVHVLDQAVAFSTIAAEGRAAKPYLVQRVVDRDGEVVFNAAKDVSEVLDADIAADVTHAMQAVVERGTGKAAKLDGRPTAGKTGTTQNNADAWFVGYTPQLSTAVWMGFDKPNEKQLKGILGRDVTGGSFPAQIFKRYMDEALQGQPVEQFPEPKFVGRDRDASPRPQRSAATESASAAPTVTATELPSFSPEPTPSEIVITESPSEAPPTQEPSPTPSPAPSESPPPPEPSPSPSGDAGARRDSTPTPAP